MNTYTIRVTTIDNLYADYIIEANNLSQARIKVLRAFERDYPDCEIPKRLTLTDPKPEIITEIINIIKEEK